MNGQRWRTVVESACLVLALVAGAVAPAPAQPVPVITEYYHVDAVGSVRVVTNDRGVVVRRYDFAPFGEQDSPCVSSPDARLFTGHERDRETCLDYLGARYYRSTNGRFLTLDPALDASAALVDPQRWNRYAYANNNPLKYVDPDGREIAIMHGGRLINVGFDTVPVGQPNAAALLMIAAGAATAQIGPAVATLARGAFNLAFGCALSPGCQSTIREIAEGAAGGSGRSVESPRAVPSAGQLAAMERMLRNDGRLAVEKSIRTLERRIDEHLVKIAEARAKGGFWTDMEREVRNFRQLIEAAKKVIEP